MPTNLACIPSAIHSYDGGIILKLLLFSCLNMIYNNIY